MIDDIGFICTGSAVVHEGFHLVAGHVFSAKASAFFPSGGFLRGLENINPENGRNARFCASSRREPYCRNINSAAGKEWFLHEFIRANLVIGLFNLIPLYPMDGGSVLPVLLYSRLGPKELSG